MAPDMMGMLKEIAEAAPKATWAAMPLPESVSRHDKTAKSYIGKVGDWSVLVMSFSIEDQGHPVGSRGYDGTATKEGTVLRLTKELSEKLVLMAEKGLGVTHDDPDKKRGLYKKFTVTRVHDPEDKHGDCEYFVLDLNHDPHAAAALFGYAESCEKDYPRLAKDLRLRADALCKKKP